jgi:5-methylcytosine-specific restriction endonuclease McrA
MEAQIIKCTVCKLEKNSVLFHNNKKRKTGKSARCKQCISDYQIQNKEKISKKRAEWQKANPDKVKEYTKKYLENKRAGSGILPKVKKTAEEQKAQKLRRQSKYRDANKEKISLYKKEYYKNNLEKKRLANYRRRAMKANNGHEPYTEKQVLDFYGTDCHICLSPIDLNASRVSGIGNWEMGLHLDHVIELSMGGPDALNNVKPAHALCNLKKKPVIL